MTDATSTPTLNGIVTLMQWGQREHGLVAYNDSAAGVHGLRCEYGDLEVFFDTSDRDNQGWAWRLTEYAEFGEAPQVESSSLDSYAELKAKILELAAFGSVES
jgi:hypothetical protein